MRACGEVRLALYNACRAIATPERGATLREMALHAQVGMDAARRTVSNMARAEQLFAVRERQVDYRNRPVVEYAPFDPREQAAQSGGACLWRVWG